MITRFFRWMHEIMMRKSKTPWARFETSGIKDGQVKYEMSWNYAFLENLKNSGFNGHNEQEIVEQFFLGSLIIPKELALENEFKNDEQFIEPSLTSENNRLRK